MADEKLLNGLAIFASSYVKRFLETHYDTLMRTAPARKLMEAGAPTRYGIEAALYALLAYAEQHWSTHTPLRTLIREVAMDAPAEVSKRLVNGFREELLSSAREGTPDVARSVEQTLLQLDDETLGALLAWLGQTSRADRTKIRSLLGGLSEQELRKVARLAPEDLDTLLGPSPPADKPPSRLGQVIKDELEKAHRRVDEQLEARRRWRQP